jgi:uncharacterized membrane protein (DUF2068 family)
MALSQKSYPPELCDERSSAAGLRAVATFEAVKGGGVILLAIVVFAIHSRAEDVTESFLYHMHIDPDRRIAHMLMNAATKVSDARLLTIAAAALTYATVRFVEAWGLWNKRVWAEWFALLSGAMYLPWELLRIIERMTWERVAVLVINIAIVLYMLWIRLRARTQTRFSLTGETAASPS